MNAPASGPLPPGFVRLADAAPAVRQDLRYASARNFTGAPVAGYEAADAWLHARAAEALAAASANAAREGLTLLVWDAYRPQRASDRFRAWSQEPGDGDEAARALRARLHPRIPRGELFARGYLSARSSHSRGLAVDLGLVDADGALLDFGTEFDFFDPLSATACEDVSRLARDNRARLRRLMEAQGFRNDALEWWHYDLPVADEAPIHDVPIR